MRVLQVLGTIGLGGAESRVMDIYRHMDRDRIQFDFLVTEGTVDQYADEVKSMSGRIYHLPAFRVYNYGRYVKACREFFEAHCDNGVSEYVAVHGHMTSTASIYLPIAARYGVPLTIAHARSAGVDPGFKGVLTRWMRHDLKNRCDVMLACSDEAGDSVFGAGSGYRFVPNAVDMSEYAYDEALRQQIRDEYGIGDDVLIGHIGSFRYAKNHEFIIEVFFYLHKLVPATRLMLVGDGELRSTIEKKAADMGLSDCVIFTGNKKPVSPYYQAFDAMLFPSFYEGMPGTVVEAQASGLPCLISDSITKQVIFTDKVHMMSLSRNAEDWAGSLMDISIPGTGDEVDRIVSRKQVTTLSGEPLSSSMYDVRQQVEFYEKLYKNGPDRG